MRRAFATALSGLTALAACGSFGSDNDATPKVSSENDASTVIDSATLDVAESPDDAGRSDGAFAEAVRAVPGLFGYWRLDYGGKPAADDVSGNDRHGQYLGVPASAASLLASDPNGATSFNLLVGKEPPAAMAVTASFEDLTKSFTVGALFRAASLRPSQWVLGKTGTFGFYLTAEALVFSVSREGGGGGAVTLGTPPYPIQVETTYFVVGVFDASSGKQRVFVNGTPSNAPPTPTAAVVLAAPFCVGAVSDAPSSCKSSPFQGDVDEVFLSVKPLDDAAVQRLTDLALAPKK